MCAILSRTARVVFAAEMYGEVPAGHDHADLYEPRNLPFSERSEATALQRKATSGDSSVRFLDVHGDWMVPGAASVR